VNGGSILTIGASAPLGTRRLSGAMPWVIAMMTGLAMLATAAALVLTPAATALSGQIAGRATIQLVQPDPLVRRAEVAELRRMLADEPYVTAVRTLPEAETARLAERWLGEGISQADLPLPALIDVDVVRSDEATIARLGAAVRAATPEARVIPHAEWLGPVAGMMNAIGWIAAAIAAMLIVCAAVVAVLAVRAALSAQRPMIDILHLVGATDVQVARLFQRLVARDVIAGSALGAIVALGLALLVAWQTRGMAAGLADGAGGMASIVWMLLVPPLVIGIAILSSRIAVIRALRELP
jgi:cell division transport system permease protein